jgi:hypothetical protein
MSGLFIIAIMKDITHAIIAIDSVNIRMMNDHSRRSFPAKSNFRFGSDTD